MYPLFKVIFKVIFLILFLKINIPINAQTETSIDSLLLKSYLLNQQEGNPLNAIDTAFEAIRQSEKIGYDRGMKAGYYNVAVLLSDYGEYEKSIEYIDKAKRFKSVTKNKIHDDFNLLLLQTSNNYELGFYSLAHDNYNETRKSIAEEKNYEKQQHLQMLLFKSAWKAYDNEDSQLYYYYKAKEIIDNAKNIYPDDYPKTEILIKKAEIYDRIGEVYFNKNELDSAMYYFDFAHDIAVSLDIKYAQGISLGRKAMVSEKQNKYVEAIQYLNLAEEIFSNKYLPTNLSIIYNSKQRIFEKIDDKIQQKKYLSLYVQLKDSLDNTKVEGREMTIKSLIQDKEEGLENNKKKLINMFIMFGIILFAMTFCLFYLYKKYKIKIDTILQKNKLIFDNLMNNIINKEKKIHELSDKIKNFQQEIVEKEIEIDKKEQEVLELKKRTASYNIENKNQHINNDIVNEIITLAKSNDPNFLLQFQEIYPNYLKNMLNVNATLKKSELTLGAYLSLGFTSKEIANYTFKSIRTIENNRHNLRKKLNIDASIDLNLWLKDITL